MTEIGFTSLLEAATLSFTIPTVIPANAREVMIEVAIFTGNTNGHPITYIKVFTQIRSTRYEKYLSYIPFPTKTSYSTNSDNMWFPMPPNGIIYVTIPVALVNKNGGVSLIKEQLS